MNWALPTTLAIALTAALISSCCAGEAGAGTQKPLDLPKDFFPIMPWDTMHGFSKLAGADYAISLESLAECNFTMTAFATPADLPVAEKLGLKAIMAPPTGDVPWKKKWLGVSREEMDQSVKRWVEACGKSKAVVAYHITDEPGTPKFPALGMAVEALGRYAPGKLAYINLLPGYATIGAPDKSQLGAASYEEYLERFVKEVKPQVLSYDDYMVQYSDDFQDKAHAAIYFRDLLDVRRAGLKHGIPFWNTVASCQIRPFTAVPSPANLFVQAYTTLAAGGRGIAWYIYYQRGYAYCPIGPSGAKTDTWHYLRTVNGQVKTLGPIVNRLTSTGVFFSKPWPSDDVPQLPGGIVDQITSRSSVRKLSDFEPPMMVGEFRGEDGCDYVMVVNLSLERSANFTLRTHKEYARREVISASDGSLSPLDEENGQWLVAGGGVLIKLVEAGK